VAELLRWAKSHALGRSPADKRLVENLKNSVEPGSSPGVLCATGVDIINP
jgi:hypothetical protein